MIDIDISDNDWQKIIFQILQSIVQLAANIVTGAATPLRTKGWPIGLSTDNQAIDS